MKRIIYNSHNGTHPIIAEKEGSTLTLRFGTNARQSCINPTEPNHLILDYTKWLMTALLFTSNPTNFLVLGLGGGTITQFLLHHHKDSHIDSVERCQTVINIAHDCFNLPQQTNKFRIFNQDARYFLSPKNPATLPHYHIAFIDIYEPDCMAPLLFQSEFYSQVLQKLSPNGIMAVNLWDGNKKLYQKALAAIYHSCNGNCLLLPVKKRSNRILLVFPYNFTKNNLSEIKNRAGIYSQHYGLPFNIYLKYLKKPKYLPLFNFFMGSA